MSTYLLALIVSDFHATNRNNKHRIFALPEDIKNGRASYALNTTNEVLLIMENYIGMNFTLSKLDHFAFPKEFVKSGTLAMENWGLITYR
jgi:aminopeptidase N